MTISGRMTIPNLLPRRADYADLRSSWRGDVLAGVTVGVVALPLALAFGITSGLGATAGLMTAIVAGFVAALLGGSNVQVSGPTGAMTVVLVPIVAKYGADAALVVAFLAGILLVAAAFARLGRLLAYFPWPVVEGFTVGIAVVIFLQQVPHALGITSSSGEGSLWLAAQAVRNALDAPNLPSLALVALTITVMLALPCVHRSLPASLIAIGVATIAVVLTGVDVVRIGALPDSLPMPSLPALGGGQLGDLFGAALAVAALASIESLLSAKVADGMSDTRRHDPERELFGQGLANVAASMFGGMPATGAIARTAVNVRAGARTRVSAMVHSGLLILIVLFAGSIVAQIPLAALAGVLMVTAARMVERHNVRAVLRATRADALVLILTAGATIAFDLIVAVEFGLALAAIFALSAVARSSTATMSTVAMAPQIDPTDESDLMRDHIVAYRLDGALFFGASQRFLTELTAVSDVRVVILRLPDIQVLDATGARALGEIVAELESRHITVLLKGPRREHLRILQAVGALDRLAHKRHVFQSLDDAVAHAHMHVARAKQAVDAAQATPDAA